MKKKFVLVFISLMVVVVSTSMVGNDKKLNDNVIQVKDYTNKNIEIQKSNEKKDKLVEEKVIIEKDEEKQENIEMHKQEEVLILENKVETDVETPIRIEKETQNQNKAKIQEQVQPKQEAIDIKQESNIKFKCSENNHSIGIGNSNKWFNFRAEAIEYYEELIKMWGDKWENFEIDSETYDKNCPYGYEILTCPSCGQWTINFYYR